MLKSPHYAKPQTVRPNCIMTRRTLIILSLISFSFVEFGRDNGNADFVEVNGKKLYYIDKGVGNPTIVLITGLGVAMDDFSELQTKLSKTYRTISYDRAGIGQSEVIDNERDLENMSTELNSVLSKIGINKPVVLVGHSRGGLLVRYFVNKYPDKVSGLILIDPAIPELKSRKRALRTDEEKTQFDNFYKAFYSDTVKFSQTIKSEFKNFYTTDSTLLVGKNFPTTIPITIIASNKTTKEKYSKEDIAIKVELLKDYIKTASQINLVFTHKSGHFIYSDQPKLVIKEITAMADKLK